MLQVAAVAGRRVDHHLLAEVAAQPPERLVESLREAVAYHLLVIDADSGAYAFRHALVQEAIYDAWYCLASLRHSRWCYPGRSSPCSVKRSIRDGPARNPVVLMRATVSR